jgi:hypothetical protein
VWIRRAGGEQEQRSEEDETDHGSHTHRLLVTNWSISSVVEIARELIS